MSNKTSLHGLLQIVLKIFLFICSGTSTINAYTTYEGHNGPVYIWQLEGVCAKRKLHSSEKALIRTVTGCRHEMELPSKETLTGYIPFIPKTFSSTPVNLRGKYYTFIPLRLF